MCFERSKLFCKHIQCVWYVKDLMRLKVINSMNLRPFREVDSGSADRNSTSFMEPKDSLSCLQKPSIDSLRVRVEVLYPYKITDVKHSAWKSSKC